MNRPHIISILNHKGGVLKTTSVANLGAALTRNGKKVLVIDLDAQQNLSTLFFGMRRYDPELPSLFKALTSLDPLTDLIKETTTPNLHVICSDEDFMNTDLVLQQAYGRERALADCLAKTPGLSSYDYVLIDNPPAMSLVVVNSLVASDFYLVPCGADYLSITGLTMLQKTISEVGRLNSRLSCLGVFLTQYDKRTTASRGAKLSLTEALGGVFMETKIRINTKARNAPAVRETIFQHEKSDKGRGTEDYLALAREVEQRIADFSQLGGGRGDELTGEAANG